MRQTTFLRTPIRADHQGRLLNLQIGEQAFASDPRPTDVYPQTLLVSFGVAAGTTEVQIAPLWEGSFKFLADSTDGYPTDPSEVTEANFPQWRLIGDLVLDSGKVEMFDIKKAFPDQVPLISPAPSIVRYSKIKLTKDFLFVSMSGLQGVFIISGGKKIDTRDPKWREKLIIAFLHGKASVPCQVHNSDPTKDFALKPMPSVNLQPTGAVTTLKVTIASRVAELANNPAWFAHQAEIDNIFVDRLVDPGFDTRPDWKVDAGHPSHSVISPLALYSSALPTAFASEHGPSTPLRIALTAARSDGKTYRRIELLRSTALPTMGYTSSNPQRPFPMHQLSWRLLPDGPVESVRIPLSGRLYLPLVDGEHSFWANPRSRVNPGVDPAAKLMLSVDQPAKRFLSMPAPSATLPVGAVDRQTKLYANLLEYDGARAWMVIRTRDDDIEEARAEAEKRWNVDVLRLFIHRLPDMAQYSPIYGHIRAAAMRHFLAPEFLHAVIMGEGLGGEDGLLEQISEMEPIPKYEPSKDTRAIGAVSQLGLDWIADDIEGSPIPIGDRDIGIEELIANQYLDGSEFDALVLTDIRTFTTEAEVTHWTGDPKGWLTAIELVAAETHKRLDQMLDFLEGEGRFIANLTETQRRFLAYARYNTERRVKNWERIGRELNSRCSRWPIEGRPSGPDDRSFPPLPRVTYNSVQRLAVAEWYEQVGVYR